MNKYTLEDAIKFVDSQSPASSDEDKIAMAKHILKVMAETNESPERIWLINSYWE